MAKLRVGFSSDFVLENSEVGIGTTNPTAKLHVSGVLKGDFNITGVSTLRSYGGFIPQKQNIATKSTTVGFATVGLQTVGVSTGYSYYETETGYESLVGEYNTLSDDLIVDDGKIFEIKTTSITGVTTIGTQSYDYDTSRVDLGTLESISIQSHFTLPNGGIETRPENPIEGTVRFNDDLNTLEFYNGIEWRQFTVTGASGRAVFFGGYLGATGTTRTASMDLINIPTLGNSINFGNLESARTDTQGCSDGTRGLCAGGYFPARLTDTEYITLASAGNSIQFGDLAVARNAHGGCSSSTRGLFAGGIDNNAGSPTVLQIDYFQISTLGTALDFGDSTTSRTISGGIPSSTRAVWGAGTNRVGDPATITAVSMMDYSTFASKGNAVEFGNDILPRDIGNGCSSGTRGVFAGGYASPGTYSSSPSNREMARKMSYVTIASTGNAIEFGELSAIRTYIGSDSTSTRGIWTGGSNYPAHYDDIEYIQFSSLGNTIDFGNLHSFKGYMRGSASDSHGGLGGF